MPSTRAIVLNLLLFLPVILVSQAYQPFLDLLQEKVSPGVMEKKLDSFFLTNLTVLSPKELAECYHDRGGRWHYNLYLESEDQKELDKAIFYTKKALELKQQFALKEKCAINRTLFNLGLFHNNKGLLKIALTYYLELIQKGATYCDADEAAYLTDWATIEAAIINMEVGDYHKASDLLENIIANFAKETSIADDRPFWAYYRIAEVYMAMDLFSNSDRISSYLSLAQKFIEDKEYECCFYQNRIDQLDGNRLSEIGNYSLSIKKHLKVVAHLERVDSVNLAIAHNSLGHSYFKINKLDSAIYHLESAHNFDQLYDSPYNNLGDIYAAQGQHLKALAAYQQAINRAINKNMNLAYDQLPSLEQASLAPLKAELLNHLIFKARGWISYYEDQNAQEKLEMALATVELADNLVDVIKNENQEYQSKLYWREQGSQLYAQAVKLSFLLNDSKKAYYFMERNKALLLLEDLTQEEAKDLAHIPQVLADREFSLKRSIYLAENVLFESDNDRKDKIDSLKSLVNKSKYVYQKYIDSLNAYFPDYAKFKKKVHILTYEELMARYVSNEQLVLHYILNEDDGYGLLTGVAGSILFQLENPSQLSSKIDTLTTLLSSGISDFSTFKATSYDLFNTLIPEAVYKKIRDKRLIIIPDYTLQRIPFETLVVDKSDTKYLMEDVEISYVYSMSLLDHNVGDVRNHTKQLLSFAPVNFDQLELVALRNSESEISGIAPFFEGDIFLNDKASKANFLKGVDDPKIIHLATHADIGDGENPWIAFSDEKMYLKEIYATKNQSEMVVLSACNTLSGDLKRGEGVMSLARGFFYSGAKSVVSSLWPLTDESGSDIMISFYQNLNRGHSKSKALRQAKLDYMNSNIVEELKHPFYWAGFVVVGDNAPLVATQNPIWIYIGIVLALAILYVFRHKLLKRLQ